MASTVLIISNDHDAHADAVTLELYKRNVPVFRFLPEDFPHAYSVSIEIHDGRIEGEIINAHHRVAFSDICAAWFRRTRNLFAKGPSHPMMRIDDFAFNAAIVNLNRDTVRVRK